MPFFHPRYENPIGFNPAVGRNDDGTETETVGRFDAFGEMDLAIHGDRTSRFRYHQWYHTTITNRKQRKERRGGVRIPPSPLLPLFSISYGSMIPLVIPKSRGSITMNRQVHLTKRVKTSDGLRFCPVIIAPNGRVKPDWILIAGMEERHPEGAYYLEWYEGSKRIRQSV